MGKAKRILDMYDRLYEGKVLVKADEASQFQVSLRTIQRDLDDIRVYVRKDKNMNVIYDKKEKGFRMQGI